MSAGDEKLADNLFDHCLGAGCAAASLVDHGTLLPNWESKYLSLLSRARSVWGGEQDLPARLVAALHFASLYLPVRYEMWARSTGSRRPKTEKALHSIRFHTEMFLMSPSSKVTMGSEPVGPRRNSGEILPPHIVGEVGGLVNEVGFALAVYGETLEPDVITTRLGIGLLQTGGGDRVGAGQGDRGGIGQGDPGGIGQDDPWQATGGTFAHLLI